MKTTEYRAVDRPDRQRGIPSLYTDDKLTVGDISQEEGLRGVAAAELSRYMAAETLGTLADGTASFGAGGTATVTLSTTADVEHFVKALRIRITTDDAGGAAAVTLTISYNPVSSVRATAAISKIIQVGVPKDTEGEVIVLLTRLVMNEPHFTAGRVSGTGAATEDTIVVAASNGPVSHGVLTVIPIHAGAVDRDAVDAIVIGAALAHEAKQRACRAAARGR